MSASELPTSLDAGSRPTSTIDAMRSSARQPTRRPRICHHNEHRIDRDEWSRRKSPGATTIMQRMFKASMPPEAANMPDPGDDLITRVVGGPDHPWFYSTGQESVREIERTLAIVGRSLDSFESILDFGCGCGRVLLWLEELAKTRSLYGTDIDAEAIAWCREHIPYVKFSINAGDPPLPFGDSTFDLVYSHSVFTHIDEWRQDAWLSELCRVARPGGLLILSTHGEVALGDDPYGIRQRLEDEGIVFIDDAITEDFPLPAWYQNTYHAPWYIFEHWGRWFQIRGYVPGGALGVQDHVLLERTDTNTPIKARPRRQTTRLANPEAALFAARTARIAALTSRSRFGSIGQLARRTGLRLMRPHTHHQEVFNSAVVQAVEEISHTTNSLDKRLHVLEDHRRG